LSRQEALDDFLVDGDLIFMHASFHRRILAFGIAH
jgi:hypothetical protein